MSIAHTNIDGNNDDEDCRDVQKVVKALPPLPILQSSPKPRSGSTPPPRKQLPAVPKRDSQALPPITVLETLGSAQISNPVQPPNNDGEQLQVPRLNPENISLEKNKKRVSALMSKLKLTILCHETIQDKKPYTVRSDIMTD